MNNQNPTAWPVSVLATAPPAPHLEELIIALGVSDPGQLNAWAALNVDILDQTLASPAWGSVKRVVFKVYQEKGKVLDVDWRRRLHRLEKKGTLRVENIFVRGPHFPTSDTFAHTCV
jgi:hypothetical protein